MSQCTQKYKTPFNVVNVVNVMNVIETIVKLVNILHENGNTVTVTQRVNVKRVNEYWLKRGKRGVNNAWIDKAIYNEANQYLKG